MPKVKAFDCVEMKNEIQREMLEMYEGLSPEEIRVEQRTAIEKDPILGPLYRQMVVCEPNGNR
jgi:hypothetical protein